MTDHDYRYDTDCKCNICARCGASDWQGKHWFAGLSSANEPPCMLPGDALEVWKKAAEESAQFLGV